MSSKGLCKSLFFLALLSLASAFGDSNLLRNPGFESGIAGWTDRSCSIEAVTSPVHSGSGSARAYGRNDNWQGIKQSMVGKMVDGETYKVSGWVRLEGLSSDTVIVSVEQQDDDGVNYHNVASVTATDSNWVQLSGEFTLYVDGELSVLDVYFEGPAAGVNFFVDDANVYGPGVGPAEPSSAEAVAAVKPKATGEIDANTRHQVIEGIGASGAHYTMEFVRHKQKSELYNLLFKELGLDIFRIRNNHGTEPNSFSETVEIVKGAKAALGRDLKIIMSSWSPPTYLKSSGSTMGGTLKKNDGKYMYTEFAQWWYDSLAAYEKAGVKVDYVSIQNEPDYQAGWDSCHLEPTETLSSAGYDAAFEAVRQKLNKEIGSSMPKMLAPETSGLDRIGEYIDNLDDLSHVYGYAHHLYNCSGDGDNIPGCGAAPDRYLSAMKRFKSKYGTKPLIQTEYEHRPGEWDDAMNTAVLMHNALTAEGVSAYLYWDLFWGSMSGLASIDDPCSITIKPTYYTFKQYSAFVDSGWQRVEASSDSSGLRISAYISPDKQKLTAIIINTTISTDITLDLSFKGFSVSKGEIYRSSQTEKCDRLGSYNGNSPLTLPANSVTTLAF
jgi:glucuronoarabinoxylan endo-1,4-beta-xylanase